MIPRFPIPGFLVFAVGLAAACSSGRSIPAPLPATANESSGTPSVSSALAQAGYIGLPLHRVGEAILVQATLGAQAVNLQLAAGAPFDLLLDTAFAGATGILHTSVLSGYWTSATSKGHWARVDQLTVGAMPLQALEARIEPSSTPALLGATALMSRGAVIDYATDTLYLLSPSAPATPAWHPASKQKSLRTVLEQAGQYRTFLDLMQRAGLMQLLDENTGPDRTTDSIAWLGLRIRAPLLSGVAEMPPNDVHLHLTRSALSRRLRRQGRRTAFVPTDAAFAQLPANTLRALRADTAQLARLLRAHLLPGTAIDTVEMRTYVRGVAEPDAGAAFGFQVLGPRIDVDRLNDWKTGRVVARATIVQPDLLADNGIAHGIDRLLSPTRETPSLSTTLGAALARQGYIGVPLSRREDGNGYWVQATVNGMSVALTIDTGTPTGLVLDQGWAAKHPPAAAGYTVAFDSASLGTIDGQTVDLSDSIQWTEQLGYRSGAGTVGSSLLARYGAVIDYAAGMLYLRRTATP